MKKVSIVYNPYRLSTKIEIDEHKPTPESSLNVGSQRLQEWVERLPKILVDEYKDNEFLIKFTGTQVDFGDLVESFEYYKKCHESLVFRFVSSFDEKGSGNFIKKADVADVEKEIDDIFNEIKYGIVDELKDQRILDAFERAKNQQFEINVVATMSAGKSTLINALLKNRLMPAKQKATTNNIVRISDDKERKDFSAKTYDKDGALLEELKKVSFADMERINSDPQVSCVELHGPIPFVSSTGMKLALVDTPGPNNSRDSRHRQMTYEMLENSEKSLVLFVMNCTQSGTDDEMSVLRHIYKTMKGKGKQGRERYIFAVNKMDLYKPGKEGYGCIQKHLEDVKKDLEGFGIIDPNVFPVCALPALQLLTNDNEPDDFDTFKKNIIERGYGCMHFDNYYTFSHLPLSSKLDIEADLEKADEDGKVLIHTGIKSIEEAINLYITKYARTIKVNDLVRSFNGTLDELATIAELEKAIKNDKSKRGELKEQITAIRKKIKAAKNAKTISAKIENIDLSQMVQNTIGGKLTEVRNDISNYIKSQRIEVEKEEALRLCEGMKSKYDDLMGQTNAQINKIVNESFKEVLNSIIEEYKKHLNELNIGGNEDALNIKPIDLVVGHLDSLSKIIDSNADEKDKGHWETIKKPIPIPSQKVWYKPWTWFKQGAHNEEREFKEWVSEYKTVVDMRTVAGRYLTPILVNLDENEERVKEYITAETKRLKEILEQKLNEIDDLLENKLNGLEKATEDCLNETADEITRKEENLKWLEGIQKRVEDLVGF